MENILSSLWKFVLGVNLLAQLLLAVIFIKQQGRFRVYLGGFLFVTCFETGVATVTAILASPDGSTWFILPRIVTNTLQAVTAIGVVLYLFGWLNGHSLKDQD